MALISSVRNLTVGAEFDDPDEITYGESIASKEIEVRAANVVPGAGSLVELRQHTAPTASVQIPEAEQIGEQIDACDSATGWVAGTATVVAADTGVKNEGSASIRLTVTALGAGATSLNRSNTGKALKFLYGPNTKITVDVRASTLTNLSAVRIRLTMAGGTPPWLSFTITPGAANAWETKSLNIGSPFATSGTMPIAQGTALIDKIEVDVIAGASAYTGIVYVDNVRVGTVLAWESSYDVRVRYKDAAATFGPWSGWTVFKVSQPPVVAQGTALDNTDGAPTVDWTFTSPGGKAQARYRITVSRTSDGAIVYDSGEVASALTSAVVPGGLLANATQHAFVVQAWDTDGLSGTWSPAAITSSFSVPAALASATATASPGDSSVVVGWAATALSAAQFYSYVVYRRDPDTLTYYKIAEILDSATLAYTDREAPHRVTAAYQVRQSNGFAESEPVNASTTLALDYWVTHPTDPSLVFPIPHVEKFSERFPLQRERYEPLDRPTAVVVLGQSLPPDGSISFRRFPSQPDPIEDLRRAQKAMPYVILKSPFGDVRRAAIGEIATDRAGAGVRVGSFDYTTVG